MELPLKPSSLSTAFLDQPPSCLEFCPTAPNHLLLGTYLLSEDTTESDGSAQQARRGSLQLFRINPLTFGFTQVQRLSLDHAVFDLHFSPRDPSLIAVALSTAAVSLYRVIELSQSSPVAVEFIRTIPVHDDPSQLSLYLAWIPPFQPDQDRGNETDGFAVSFSGGQISVFHADSTPSHELTRDAMSEIQFPASPPIEVWFVAFNSTRESGSQMPNLFSGDDFAQIREFVFPPHLNSEHDESEDAALAPYQKYNDRGRHHEAGVTAILPLFSDDSGTVLLTGSYDGCVRVYRPLAKPSVLAEKDLGGGVWRLKLIHTTSIETTSSDDARGGEQRYYLLASCMHAGARVVEVSHIVDRRNGEKDGESWSLRILAEFTEHTSMNYASDIWTLQREVTGDAKLSCVSSSFYDKRVCTWTISIPGC